LILRLISILRNRVGRGRRGTYVNVNPAVLTRAAAYIDRDEIMRLVDFEEADWACERGLECHFGCEVTSGGRGSNNIDQTDLGSGA